MTTELDPITMESMIDFVGFEPAAVLRALHDTAPPVSKFHYRWGSLNLDYAEDLLNTRNYIEYLKGRYLYIDFQYFPLIDPDKYDEQNGSGMMEKALDSLQKAAAMQ